MFMYEEVELSGYFHGIVVCLHIIEEGRGCYDVFCQRGPLRESFICIAHYNLRKSKRSSFMDL